MQRIAKKLLSIALAALLALAFIAPSALADWRDQLRDAFGLTDDYDSGADEEESGDIAPDDEERQADAWDEPITDPQQIVNYLDAYGRLPDNFLTKKEARELGWDSSYNYVGDVAPGMSIGGDRFGNYEGQLPSKKGRTWYECDANYRGRKRGAERILFSSDGLYYYTNDHYNTFTQMFPEE